MKDSSKMALVRSWVGHVEKMVDEKLVKRADAQKVEGNGGEEEDRHCDGGLY